jgi:hypothetical protein
MVADALLDPDSEDYKFSHFEKLKIAQVYNYCFHQISLLSLLSLLLSGVYNLVLHQLCERQGMAYNPLFQRALYLYHKAGF